MYRTFGKRAGDILLATVLLILLAPLLALVSSLVWLRLGPPLLFRQRRAGLRGKPFTIVKFRTMTDARDASGKLRPDADRLTRLGRFLRRASIDELPQLWNVLRGDMSLVGPRPLFVEYLDRYTPEQLRRHDVRPGITGLAQVRGRNALLFSERLRHDVEYVDRHSLCLDCHILVMTVYLVGFGKLVDGAGQDVAVVDDLGLHPDSPAYARRPATGGRDLTSRAP
jgi:lipopolysaccharide/colanic/teichoic acid biosynthesis glycosyltransferase